jgi:uncharacterized membrane protein YkgB
MKIDTVRLDHEIIHFLRRAFVPSARVALFIVYFWFGILKLLGYSPAGALVHQLFDATIHFMSFNTFYVLFALFEMLIGILFLFPRVIRIAIPLLFIHMITTVMPLFVLPDVTWNGFLLPTIEGQYIIKNFVIMAIAIGIASHANPLPWKKGHTPSH